LRRRRLAGFAPVPTYVQRRTRRHRFQGGVSARILLVFAPSTRDAITTRSHRPRTVAVWCVMSHFMTRVQKFFRANRVNARSRHASRSPLPANRLRPDSQIFRVSEVSERSAAEIFAAESIIVVDRLFRTFLPRVMIHVRRGDTMFLSHKLYMEGSALTANIGRHRDLAASWHATDRR